MPQSCVTGRSISKVRLVFVLAFVMLMEVASVAGQSGRRLPPRAQTEDDAIRLRADEVLLSLTVIDPYGRQVTDLRKEEFIVAEDGERQEISSFAVRDIPVSVVMLLDASGSVIGEIEFLRKAAMEFVSELKAEDQVSIISFHTDVELIQDWTRKPEEIRHAISWRFKPGMVRTEAGRSDYGMTSLYDALFLTATDQLGKVEGRKAIVLLTDGDDTSSTISYEQGLRSIIRTDAVVYVISKARAMLAKLEPYRGRAGRVLGGGTAGMAEYLAARLERAERLMTDLARRTGGAIYSPLDDKEMAMVYGQIAREIKNQYMITYIPRKETLDGRFRSVNVYLTRGGYQVRTRDGYYAPTARD